MLVSIQHISYFTTAVLYRIVILLCQSSISVLGTCGFSTTLADFLKDEKRSVRPNIIYTGKYNAQLKSGMDHFFMESPLFSWNALFSWNCHYFHGIATIRQVATMFNIIQLFLRNRSYFGRISTLSHNQHFNKVSHLLWCCLASLYSKRHDIFLRDC